MEGRSAIQQRFIDNEVAKALIRAGLPYDSPLREKLNSDAEIIGPPGEGYLRMRDGNGELVSVDEHIKQLRADAAFRAFFPDPPKIGRGNLDEIRDNFDAISRGDMEVMR